MQPKPAPLCLAAAAVLLASGSIAAPAGYESDTRAYNLAHGRVVFTENCLQCHEGGRRGAPMVGEPADWIERLERPLDTMIDRAIIGHGKMPARGDAELTDQQIAAAVAYVVNRARVVVAEQVNALPATGAGSAESAGADSIVADSVAIEMPGPESIDDAVVQMFLLMMGKDRWK